MIWLLRRLAGNRVTGSQRSQRLIQAWNRGSGWECLQTPCARTLSLRMRPVRVRWYRDHRQHWLWT
jgi:hypothetical protein